ncbi:MAG: DUF1295 domain-containing protein [Lentimicrobiaceae bacterium]|nr:DUF1295 domain-containing protein [Lentimicrobiaceae bacterium]
MSIIAVIVFIALYFVTAGYGVFYNKKWGPSIPNKIGWVLMESPVFIAMILLCVFSERSTNVVCLIFLILFEIHYFQRSFIFPFLIRGKSVMPLSVILMGVVFNTLNALMQGGWIFYVAPENMYEISWLTTPQFIIGTLFFFVGMIINIHSDYIIRHLRKPGDTKHYLPKKGMFKYVTSANYFGEFVEWCGFAILTWSLAGAVFALWTFANLAPRAAKIYDNYKKEFGNELDTKKVKRILPFIY